MSQNQDDKGTENQDEVYERLKASKFKQQKLPAWRPVPTITSTTITFVSFGVIFIIIGIIILIYSNKIHEVSIRYDTECTSTEENSQCETTIKIDKKIEKDVMVYYQINNFYQNHRRYVKSKSDDQLKGKTNDVAVPCGLIAKSFFKDTFELKDPNGNKIEIDSTDIAWKADRELKYKNGDMDKQWIDMTDEHFIVWMRPSGLPNFRKLWGRIHKDLEPGDYKLIIKNRFDVASFSGQKHFVLSNVNAFGGKNTFLAVSYIVVGVICIILAVVFLIGYNIHQKKQK